MAGEVVGGYFAIPSGAGGGWSPARGQHRCRPVPRLARPETPPTRGRTSRLAVRTDRGRLRTHPCSYSSPRTPTDSCSTRIPDPHAGTSRRSGRRLDRSRCEHRGRRIPDHRQPGDRRAPRASRARNHVLGFGDLIEGRFPDQSAIVLGFGDLIEGLARAPLRRFPDQFRDSPQSGCRTVRSKSAGSAAGVTGIMACHRIVRRMRSSAPRTRPRPAMPRAALHEPP